MPHARKTKSSHLFGFEMGIESPKGRKELTLHLSVALGPGRIVSRRVFGQINERMAAELRRINERGHLDDAGEGRWIRNVGDVIVGERLFQEQRSTEDAEVFDRAEPIFFRSG